MKLRQEEEDLKMTVNETKTKIDYSLQKIKRIKIITSIITAILIFIFIAIIFSLLFLAS
ncbi:hypothetical protein [Arenibacter certesii]|uniref:hypothetical protein n=1 Tax=Arenibacter certesii TaxID=228955 RepID=UPI0003F88CC9|nr:hypothetical protein [Arenibacter certesii]